MSRPDQHGLWRGVTEGGPQDTTYTNLVYVVPIPSYNIHLPSGGVLLNTRHHYMGLASRCTFVECVWLQFRHGHACSSARSARRARRV